MTKTPRRIVIVGGPKRGKSTMARAFRDEHIPTFCTDPRSLEQEPEDGITYLPEGLDWSGGSQFVADHWLGQPGPWCIEGIASVRALRKFIAGAEDPAAALQGIEIILLPVAHPDAEITPKQESTAKAVMTIWRGIRDGLEEPTTLYPAAPGWQEHNPIDQGRETFLPDGQEDQAS